MMIFEIGELKIAIVLAAKYFIFNNHQVHSRGGKRNKTTRSINMMMGARFGSVLKVSAFIWSNLKQGEKEVANGGWIWSCSPSLRSHRSETPRICSHFTPPLYYTRRLFNLFSLRRFARLDSFRYAFIFYFEFSFRFLDFFFMYSAWFLAGEGDQWFA